MNVIETQLPGVFIIEPRIYRDDRGYFLETWSAAKYGPAALPTEFAQDNLSCSSPGVLRGLHYQFPVAQGKLVASMILNPRHAKRLMRALQENIARYEAQFGALPDAPGPDADPKVGFVQ